MTEERFRALAQAFGAELRRWPAAERAAATAFVDEHGTSAAAILGREDRLDAILDAGPLAVASLALRDRVVAAARGRTRARAWRWLVGAGVGFGLAAAGAAGVVAGLTLTPASVARMIGGAPGEAADDVTALLAPINESRGA